MVEFCHIFGGICNGVTKAFLDSNTEVDNLERANVYLEYNPAGAGYRNLLHYAQEIKNGHFQRFDWGAKTNFEKYGEYTPPSYDLKALNLPTALVSGTYDKLADP